MSDGGIYVRASPESVPLCRCAETSPAPDAFDGIFHWRADCPYLNDAEKRAVRICYGEPDEALRKWREEHGAR